MPTYRRQRHMRDLKVLAELLGDVADRLPRCLESSAGLDREAQATLNAVLPKLKSTCAAVLETVTEDSRLHHGT